MHIFVNTNITFLYDILCVFVVYFLFLSYGNGNSAINYSSIHNGPTFRFVLVYLTPWRCSQTSKTFHETHSCRCI